MVKKKLFISCPMNGATKEEIDKRMHILHKLAELHFGKDLEVIDTWIDEEAPQKCKNNRVWYAGESIKRLSEADYYVGINLFDFDTDYEKYFGCDIENFVARLIDMPRCLFPKEIIVKKGDKKDE